MTRTTAGRQQPASCAVPSSAGGGNCSNSGPQIGRPHLVCPKPAGPRLRQPKPDRTPQARQRLRRLFDEHSSPHMRPRMYPRFEARTCCGFRPLVSGPTGGLRNRKNRLPVAASRGMTFGEADSTGGVGSGAHSRVRGGAAAVSIETGAGGRGQPSGRDSPRMLNWEAAVCQGMVCARRKSGEFPLALTGCCWPVVNVPGRFCQLRRSVEYCRP